MGKNLMPVIVKELGLEVEEEFSISGEDDFRFKFMHETLLLLDDDNECWYETDDETLMALIRGSKEIIKFPLKPVYGQRYYTFTDDWDITWVDCEDTFFDFMCKELNVAYRSEEDAHKARPEAYKRLTGKEWKEDAGD